jgi:hypothetical protein
VATAGAVIYAGRHAERITAKQRRGARGETHRTLATIWSMALKLVNDCYGAAATRHQHRKGSIAAQIQFPINRARLAAQTGVWPKFDGPSTVVFEEAAMDRSARRERLI